MIQIEKITSYRFELNLELVSAKKSDITIVNDLMYQSKAYWGYEADFMEKFMHLFAITPHFYERSIIKLLYETSTPQLKNLIGFYSVSAKDNNLELDNLFIHPDYIGRGIGKKLWGYLLENIKQMGGNEFTLWSDPNAEGFYKKMGCEQIGTQESPVLPGRNIPVFKYSLNCK